MNGLQNAALIYILIRTGIDTFGFLFDPVREFAIQHGWPVNGFWFVTVFPVTFMMFLLSGFTLLGSPVNTYCIAISTISFLWTYVLWFWPKRTVWMIADGVSWFIVGIAGLIVTFVK